MRFGLFYTHQLPRDSGAADEARLLADALEQVELADRLGFDCVWEVEHHFLEEYSISSAPEVFLAAAFSADEPDPARAWDRPAPGRDQPSRTRG